MQANFDLIIDGIKDSLKTSENSFNKFIANDTAKVQDVNNPSIQFSKVADFGNYGKIQVYTDFYRNSNTAVVNGTTCSVWDVKEEITTSGGYSLYASSYWGFDYEYSRIDLSAYTSVHILSHGPSNLNRQVTANVEFNKDGPTVGWSWQTYDVDTTDNYNTDVF